MIRARLALNVANARISKSLVQALEPDNIKMPGLDVSREANQHSAVFKLTYQGKIETFIFTLDDLLGCLHAARETLDTLREKELE